MPKKGYKQIEEHKKNLRKANRGKHNISQEMREKLSEDKKGDKNPAKRQDVRMKISETLKKLWEDPEYRKRMTKAFKGRQTWSSLHREEFSKMMRGHLVSTATKNKMSESLKKHFTLEIRKEISKKSRGENNSMWKGGITPKNQGIRHTIEFRLWRKAVFVRDNWACQKCKARSGNGKAVYLHPHHILNFAEYPELRFEVDNGIALCIKCHKEFHKKYGFRHNTKEQLEEFLNETKR